MYKDDLALNNQQGSISHKTQSNNQPNNSDAVVWFLVFLSNTVVYPQFTQFNERTNTLLYKNMYLSHFILERVDVSVVFERWVERHMLRERNCTRSQVRQRRLWSAACPTLGCDSLHSVQIWPRVSHHLVSFRLHTCSTWVPWSCCPVY